MACSENKKVEKYRVPPKRAFRAMGLGELEDGYIKVIAGFTFHWWNPMGGVTPHVVNARVIRLKTDRRVEA